MEGCPTDTTWIDVIGGPADIYISKCWVNPSNPLQEDQVTFYATVGNSGGTSANSVRIDAYLDGNLFSTERDNLAAGDYGTWQSNSRYIAQDGPHTLRVVANSDHAIQESNYANNEASCTFFVRPHTITAALTQTTTSTRTISQWTTTTSTILTSTTRISTTQTTIRSTVTANPILTSTTTTGLFYTTIYSPTFTTTITVSQAISSPFYLFGLPLLGLALAVKHETLAGYESLRESARSAFKKIRSKEFRRILSAIMLICVSLLSVGLVAVRPGFASTITLTVTRSQTQFTTLTTSLTSTHYTTSSIMDTSTLTNTDIQYTTTTPTSTIIINSGSTSTIFSPTTSTSYTTQSSSRAGSISIDLRILDATCSHEVTDILKGQTYCIELLVNNPTGIKSDVTISGELQFSGNPNQQVGDTWGGSWSIGADPASQRYQQQTVGLVQGQTSSQVYLSPPLYLTWNWIPPIGLSSATQDWFWSLIWDVVDILLYKYNTIFGLLWGGIDLTKEIDSTIRAALAGTFAETWNLEVSGKTSSGQSSSTSRQIRAHVAAPMEFALVTSIVTAIIAVIGSLVGITAACTLGALLTGGAAAIACWEVIIASATLGWVAWAAGSWEYKAATDPNDDYKTVPTPQIYVPPTIQGMSEGPAKDIATASMRYYAYVRAFSDAMTRYYAAESHDAQDAALNQISAAEEYIGQAQSEFKHVQGSYELLNPQPVNRTTFAQALQIVRQNPPPQLQTLFSELGQSNFKQLLFSTADNVTQLIPKDQSITINHLLESASQSMSSEANAVTDLKNHLRTITANPLGGFLADPVWVGRGLLALALIAVLVLLISRRSRRIPSVPPKEKGALSCINCGATVGVDDEYCRSCGQVAKKKR
jgi:hypothetical protein